jgi:hypothetical protein
LLRACGRAILPLPKRHNFRMIPPCGVCHPEGRHLFPFFILYPPQNIARASYLWSSIFQKIVEKYSFFVVYGY